MITEAALLTIYRETIQPLYAYVAQRSGRQRELAEDTVQETYARALAHWCRKGLPEVPLAWLKTVARNLLISHYRRITPESLDALALDPRDDNWTPADEDEFAVVFHGLARLREGQARLLEAFYFEDRSVREIAAEHGLSERAVEGRLRRARQKLAVHLRRLMAERGGTR